MPDVKYFARTADAEHQRRSPQCEREHMKPRASDQEGYVAYECVECGLVLALPINRHVTLPYR